MPVSNSSPLIHLSRLGKLGYAREVFSFITIPPAVRSETIERGKSDGYSDALALERLESDGWLKTSELSPESKRVARKLADAVGIGEAEAIALALEKNERLFVDDLKGRRTAELYKIQTTTTLGLILELLKNHALTKIDYQRNVKNYGSQGWISGDIIQEFIERGREIE
jgi:predicted nucleic acid-binding protein